MEAMVHNDDVSFQNFNQPSKMKNRKTSFLLHSPQDHSKMLLIGALVALGTMSGAFAQLVDSYNPDSQSLGALSSFTDQTGSQNATEANAAAQLSSITADPTVANTDTAFNGHNYVSFGATGTTNEGLATASSLFSGTNARSLVAVYDTPGGDNTNVNPIVGEGNNTQAGGIFGLQARDTGANNTGSPYLATGTSVDPAGPAPTADQLTFSLATYDGTNLDLYYAYGTTGTITEVTDSLAGTGVSVSTVATPLELAFNGNGKTDLGDLDLGQVLVYDSALTTAQADTEIENLQAFYTAPEPSICFMMVGGLAGLAYLIRRKNCHG
jgi:hypothetical protein